MSKMFVFHSSWCCNRKSVFVLCNFAMWCLWTSGYRVNGVGLFLTFPPLTVIGMDIFLALTVRCSWPICLTDIQKLQVKMKVKKSDTAAVIFKAWCLRVCTAILPINTPGYTSRINELCPVFAAIVRRGEVIHNVVYQYTLDGATGLMFPI